MTEYFQLILTLAALLFVFIGILSLLMRFLVAPVFSLISIPTYAAMIGVEYFIAVHNNRKCPAFLQFKRPKTFWKKLVMDLFAAYCTLVGMIITTLIFSDLTGDGNPRANLESFIINFSDDKQFALIALFWLFLLFVYLIGYFHGDDPNHPMNKLESLITPDWFKNITKRLAAFS